MPGRPEDFVALAHHRDDQAETLLLNLLRGAGIRGLAAMPELRTLAGSKARLLRPLLEAPRAALRAYAAERGLRWIEDESNASTRHDRNYLRHEIAPLLDARLPRWREAASRFARTPLRPTVARCAGAPRRAAGARGEPLAVDEGLPDERRANLLRAFLAQNGAAMPSEARLGEMARQLYGAREDAQVRLAHEGRELVLFRGHVHLEQRRCAGGSVAPSVAGTARCRARSGARTVRFEPATGQGVAASKARGEGWHFAGRSGGERLRPDPSRPTRTLKNLLQEHGCRHGSARRMPLSSTATAWSGCRHRHRRVLRLPAGRARPAPEWRRRDAEASQKSPDVLN
jgi:tRNA(Ile)-lysidine synthase